MIDKAFMMQRFVRSQRTYRKAAVVQTQMAVELISYLKQYCGSVFESILEIGCGEGLLTAQIAQHLQWKNFFANDIVATCDQWMPTISPNIQFIDGDGEETGHLPSKLNLIISNATLHWFSDVATFLKKIRHHLVPNGTLAFTTFGPDNMKELAKLDYPALNYLKFDTLQAILTALFDVRFYQEKRICLYFKTPLAILRHLQQTGVNSLARTAWTKQKFREFSTAYQQNFSTDKGLSLTYHPYYFVVKRKP